MRPTRSRLVQTSGVSATGGSIRLVNPPFSPDERQEAVLDHETGALLVTGAAGTGKSSVLRERFAMLVEGGANPERMALVVGSRRARQAARDALITRLPSSLSSLQVLTFHGLGHLILRERFSALGYTEPPEVLSAADQFALVQDLLQGQNPTDWPAYGHLLTLRGFADQIRQFLLRAQEARLTPEEIETRSEARGLTGWRELARFYRDYLDVLDADRVVDFAALIGRAEAAVSVAGTPLLDHLLVDDYHDATFAQEALVMSLRVKDLVVAADPEAHVFSFQGTTAVPSLRFTEVLQGAAHVELDIPHRAPRTVRIDAWSAAHTSEEYAAVARELRRLHVDDGVPWGDLAVVVRRQGAHVGGLLRALDDARVPRTAPESGVSLAQEPATRPFVLALRWLVGSEDERNGLIESVLTSDLVRLSPAAARGLLRVAHTRTGSVARALEFIDGLTVQEAAQVEEVRGVLDRAAKDADHSVLDTFATLWRELPCSRRLVDGGDASVEARRELDSVVAFSSAVAEAGSAADPSVEAFLASVDAGERGPGFSAWERRDADAVQVLTAHGAAGREFHTVIVAGTVEGNFPSLSRPEPMFDLAALDRLVSQSDRNRARLEDERRLFRMVLGRARERVVLMASRAHADEASTGSRFVEELGVKWSPVPDPGLAEPISVREAAAVWRRTLADRALSAAERLAALEGLVTLGVDPRRWWFQRDWTETGRPLHEHLRASYSKLDVLDNCELQFVLGSELGLGRPVGYQAWVGSLVHRIIEDCEKGQVGRTLEALTAEVDRRWRPQEFPAKAVSEAWRALAKGRMLPNWFERYGAHPASATERGFEFDYDGATIVGYIDRIGPDPAGFPGTRITDYKTGSADRAPKANESLQLGIYYLAVLESEELKEFQPISGVELSYLKGDWRNGDLVTREWTVGTPDREEAYQDVMREKLSGLVGELRRLNESGVYRPNYQANCFFCEFQSLCPLFPEGRPLFDVGDPAIQVVSEA
jgi:superfamily I DNA/RNA helicase